MITDTDRKFMRRAIELAGSVDPAATSPNPRVGCVIVEAGKIVAEGCHQYDGGPHAEVNAISALGGQKLSEATLYVTLEPCSTQGRTGACSDLILKTAGVKRVVIGTIDPNPSHQGRGVKVLKTAGIEVDFGCLASECESLNPDFNTRMKNP